MRTDEHDMPANTLESLRAYAEDHVPTGGFLQAILENDFLGACGKADDVNAEALMAIANYVYNKLPAASHGSKEAVDNWLKRE